MESQQNNLPEHSLPDEILDDIPKIYELTNFARTPNWNELGIQLKLDDVNRIQCKDYAGIYQLWLDEKGRHATRRMLLAALRDIRQNAVADSYVAYLKTITMDTCDGSPKAFRYNNMGTSPGNQGVNVGCEDRTCPIPKKDSNVVLSEKKALLGTLDMQAIVEKLHHVGTFIYIAHTCFVAAGPKFKKFQIVMQNLEFDTEELLNKSSSAVNEFKYASQQMLSHLEDAYGYLVEGKVELSIQRLQNLEVLAKDSSSVARALSLDFKKHQQQVCVVMDKTRGENAPQEYQRKRILQKKEDNRQKKMIESYYQRKVRDLEKKLQEIGEATPYDILLSTFCSQENILDIKNDMNLSKIHQGKDAAMDIKHADHFIYELERGGHELDLVSFSILPLHYASRALNDLENVMLNVAKFWYLVQIYCAKHLSESYIREDIETYYMSNPEKQLWKSCTFRTSFMKFCARFVALQSVSTEFLDEIKLIHDDFCKNQRIILTYDEARQILIHLLRGAKHILMD